MPDPVFAISFGNIERLGFLAAPIILLAIALAVLTLSRRRIAPRDPRSSTGDQS